MITKICIDCGKTWTVQHDSGTQYCRSCSRKHARIKDRLCAFCNLPFTPNSNRQIYCNRVHKRICPVCSKEYIEDNVENLKRPPVACSYECRVKRTQTTSLDKYGCIAPGNNPEARQKSKNTMQQRYGVDFTLQSEKLASMVHTTMISRYGESNPAKLPEFVSKRLETNMQKYGTYTGPMLKRVSKVNLRFGESLTRYGIQFESEYRLESKIFDFKIDDTLLEIDPTFTHSTYQVSKYSKLDPNYHLNKSKLAWVHGFKCIHVFDWEDIEKIIQLLIPKSCIYARNCQICAVDDKLKDEFLERYHIQGTCNEQQICIGLTYQNELVEIMTFGKPRYSKKHDIELLRLCTASPYKIIGGASKLFKFATTILELNNIISYCDLSKFRGDVYHKIGMKLLRTTPPQEIWSRDDKYVTANLLRERGYDQLFNTSYGKGTNNEQLMIENNWLPIYDCGQSVYEFRK